MRKPLQLIKERMADEIGSHFQQGPKRVAMLYPSPYRAGMSSLGYQWIIEILARAGFSVERVFLPDDVEEWKKSGGVLCSYETQTPLSHFSVVGISLAYELEMAGMIKCLELAGIPALREARSHKDPIFILGGPITFSNPLPSSPFVDAILLGEVEEFDSLGLITVIALYDELFNVMLSETDFENMEQVSDLITPIYDKLSTG